MNEDLQCTHFSLADFGAHLLPSVKDINTRKGISLGMLRALGCELVKLYHHPQCPRIRQIERRFGPLAEVQEAKSWTGKDDWRDRAKKMLSNAMKR